MSTPDPTDTVALRSDWDAAVTYDLLDQPLGAGPAEGASGGLRHSSQLVGREELLEPLLAAILDADGRGTVLVSGYRGAGKTTLVIEALRRARATWAVARGRASGRGTDSVPRLLPIVLNVSEVAAALTPTPPAAAPAARASITIDARRLLVALLRAFANRRAQFADHPELVTRVEGLYDKATAAEFREARDASAGRARSTSSETSIGLKADDLVKTALLPAGAVAAALAAIGAADSAWGTALKGIAAAGALGCVALGMNALVKRRDETTHSDQVRRAIAHDNSPQQLENDLKDLLARLHAAGFRTVIVIEELDKLDDEGNADLDQVIRNFKNLFTQAPALFVFITDKAYFDRIGRSIREARRKRTYAVAHTFFTHRLFVGRPGLHECLQCLASMLVDPTDRADLARIYQPRPRVTDSHVRDAQGRVVVRPEVSRLNLLARVLLFRAQNHLFDLKNELRRYVSAEGDTRRLVLDATRFPPAQQRLARFQDLVATKYETHQLRDGRPYANEVMLGCLYRVFADMGSRAEQRVSDLLISADSEEAELLDADERLRIETAVRELLSDLGRARALVLKTGGSADDPGSYQWQPETFDDFLPARGVERHESDLIAELTRVAAQAEALLAIGALDAAARTEAQRAAVAMRERGDAIAQLDAPLGVDAAQQEQRSAQQLRDRLFGGLAEKVQAAVSQRFGFRWSTMVIGDPSMGQGAWVLRIGSEDPAATRLGGGLAGVALLVVGDVPLLEGPVRELLARTSPTGWARLAVVHMRLAGSSAGAGGAAEVAQMHEQWRALADTMTDPSTSGARMPLLFSGLLVGQPASGAQAGEALRVGSETLSAQLLRAMVWSAPADSVANFFLPEPMQLRDAERLAAALAPALPRLEAGDCDLLVIEATQRLVPRVWLAAQAMMGRPEFADRWVLPVSQSFAEADDLDRLLLRAANRILVEHFNARNVPEDGRALLAPKLREALFMPGGMLLLRRDLPSETSTTQARYAEMAERAAAFDHFYPRPEVALPTGVPLLVCGSVADAAFESQDEARVELEPLPVGKGQTNLPGHGEVVLRWGRRRVAQPAAAEAAESAGTPATRNPA